jgi:predicted metalloprotease with PDZ domain
VLRTREPIGLRLKVTDLEVMIAGVKEGSPADVAGIKKGDTMVAIDGKVSDYFGFDIMSHPSALVLHWSLLLLSTRNACVAVTH